VWPRGQYHHRAWLETIDVAAARARLPVLTALNPSAGVVPDFLAPPPSIEPVTVADELGQVLAHPHEAVLDEVRQSLASRPLRARHLVLDPLLADPDALLDQVVDELGWAWETLLAPFWAAVNRLLDADITYRSRQASRSGLGRVIDGLDPAIVRRGDDIHLAAGHIDPIELGGQGLALMPSAFVWPGIVLVHDGAWPATLVYPARGIAELWNRPPVPATAVVDVLGRTRALLLADLSLAATTTTLAARHSLSPAAVSNQLRRLHVAGLLSTVRLGKEVHYRRTPLADALLDSNRRLP
jgi:DNA-binding transcriptional ArsR family regulator